MAEKDSAREGKARLLLSAQAALAPAPQAKKIITSVGAPALVTPRPRAPAKVKKNCAHLTVRNIPNSDRDVYAELVKAELYDGSLNTFILDSIAEKAAKMNRLLPKSGVGLSNPYPLSRDYGKLFDLMSNGYSGFVAFVSYSFAGSSQVHRDVCRVTRSAEFNITFAVRGKSYGEISENERALGEERDVFIETCTNLNLDWIEC